MGTTSSSSEDREHLHELLEHFSTAMLITNAGDNKLRAARSPSSKSRRLAHLVSHRRGDRETHEIEKDTRVHIVGQNDRSACVSLGGAR